jgi:hypothetical protein
VLRHRHDRTAQPYHHSSWRDGLALSRDKQNLRPGQLVVFCESRNIQLRNIDLAIVPHPGQLGPPRKAPPEAALSFRAADDVVLENVRVEWRTAEPGWQRAMLSEDVTGLKVGDDCRLPEPGRIFRVFVPS